MGAFNSIIQWACRLVAIVVVQPLFKDSLFAFLSEEANRNEIIPNHDHAGNSIHCPQNFIRQDAHEQLFPNPAFGNSISHENNHVKSNY